jgi:hypothetical protein
MAVSTKVVFSGKNKYVVNITGIWATADETDTVVIDKSALTGPDGIEPGSIRVDELTWSIGAGYDYVMLEWDHTTDDRIEILQGQGYMDYRPYGGKQDPKSAGGTGDIVLTAVGGAAPDTISILMSCTLKR